MKKIIYISFTLSKHIGVRKKNLAQMEAWAAEGYKVEPVFDLESENILFRFLWRYIVLIRFFLFKKNPGAEIYLRQTICLPFMGVISGMRGFSYEVNADIGKEMGSYTGLKYLLHLIMRDSFIGRAKKVFFVSKELEVRLSAYVNGDTYVYANSVSSVAKPKVLPRGTNVVFVGTDQYSWQGVDHLMKLIIKLPSYHFHLIGQFENEYNHIDNVSYHGVLDGDDYQNLMTHMDYSIGTLAFYRSGLSEGSPLKVRDYIAHDLPVILGYHDSDFYNSDFVLYIDMQCQSIDVKKITNFFECWSTKSFVGRIDDAVYFHNRERNRVSLICA